MNKSNLYAGHPAGNSDQRRRGQFSFLNVLIVILSIVLAVSVLITVFSLRNNSAVYYDNENMLYSYLSDGDYTSLADRYYENAIGREDEPAVQKLSEYYAVGRYYEKAFLANAAVKAQDMEKAETYRQQMEDIEKEMGQFSGEKKEILKLFPDLP